MIFRIGRGICAFLLVFLISANLVYAKSLLKKDLFEITEIFTIGVDEPSSEDEIPNQFYNISEIDVDKENNVYVLDRKAYNIKIFDENGKFVRKILKKGQGPNEISNLAGFRLNRFSGNIFVITDYGYRLKEFDTSGNFIKFYHLPEQFFHYFEFIDNARLLYIPIKSDDKKNNFNFKLLNTSTLKIEKSFALVKIEKALRHRQIFTINKNILWTSPCDQVKLIAYSLDNFEKVKEINIPGDFKQNTIKVKELVGGAKALRNIYYAVAYPLFVNRRLFSFVQIQDYKNKGKEGIEDFPNNSNLFLYLLDFDKQAVISVGNLKGCDFLRPGAVNGNRVYLFGNDPYPRVKVLKIE